MVGIGGCSPTFFSPVPTLPRLLAAPGPPRMETMLQAEDLAWQATAEGAQKPLANQLMLWNPTHGHRGRGRAVFTHVNMLKRDSGPWRPDGVALMNGQCIWLSITK